MPKKFAKKTSKTASGKIRKGRPILFYLAIFVAVLIGIICLLPVFIVFYFVITDHPAVHGVDQKDIQDHTYVSQPQPALPQNSPPVIAVPEGNNVIIPNSQLSIVSKADTSGKIETDIPSNWKTAKGKKAGYEISFKYPDESRVSISNEKDSYDEDYADDIGIDDALIVTIRNDRSQAEMIMGSFENMGFSDYKGGLVVDWFKKNVEQDFTVEKVVFESGKTFYKISGLKSGGKTEFPATKEITVYLAVFSDTPIYANAYGILNEKDRNRILSTLWVKD